MQMCERGSNRPALVLLAVAFVLRGIFLNVALPYGDPFDEPFHYAYAAFVAQTGQLPSARAPSVPLDALRPLQELPRSTTYGPAPLAWSTFAKLPPAERLRRRSEAFQFRAADRQSFVAVNYQVQHPPLFYLLGAALLRLQPRVSLDVRLLSLRLLATACGLLAVVLASRFFRMVLPGRTAIAAVAVFVALPGVGSMVGRFTNDALAMPIAAALLILLVEVSWGRLDGRRMLALSLLLAAGCWTKLSILPLIPAAPIVSFAAPKEFRWVTLRRTAAACAFAFLLFLPWLARQHQDGGDWLGLTPTKTALASGLGLAARIGALPDILHWRYAIVFGRTFLWPGTASAMGAPAAAAALLTAGLAGLWLWPLLSVTPFCERVRRAGLAAGVAVLLFLISEVSYSATYAAIARARGLSSTQMGLGWYAVILMPAVLVLGSAAGRSAPRCAWTVLAALCVVVGWWLDLGLLPNVYSGATHFNAANVPLLAYRHLPLSLGAAMRVYESVGLIRMSAVFLAAIWIAGQVALIAGVGAASLGRGKRP